MTSLQNVCGFGGGGHIVFLRGLELKPYNLKRKNEMNDKLNDTPKEKQALV